MAIIPDNIRYKERKCVELKSFSDSDVDAVYFHNQNDLFNAKNIFKKMGITCYESDIIPEERYLMERFIHGEIRVDGQPTKHGQILLFNNPHIEKANYKPDFKTLSMDIETGRDGTIYSIGFHAILKKEETIAVLMRDETKKSGTRDGYITYLSCERDLLESFIHKFNEIDPDILIGWHVIGFDLLFIERRLAHFSMQFNIGRGNSTPVIKQNPNHNWSCFIDGRVVIDGPPTLRSAFYTFENYKLETVAKEVLGVGKDINDTGKVDEIERRFREDKVALAHYNLLDCTLVTDIYNKLGIIDLIFTRAITSGLTMDRVGMSVAAFDYYMLPQIHRHGLVAPDTEDVDFTSQGKGGLVFVKEPGFYESIIVLDFKSLYPSIIRTFFIDPLSQLKHRTNTVLTPVGVPFSSSEHVLPQYIEELMDLRAKAKSENNPHLSQAIKILMNSFYGVMGTPLCRFYNGNLPLAITGTGQWLLNKTMEYLENGGWDVIYGDTDSLFIQLKDDERVDYNQSAQIIVKSINNFLKELLRKEFSVTSLLEIEYEKHFRKFFLPVLRGTTTGAKKRYAGLLSNEDGESLSLTGLEFVRSDWTELAKDFQYNLFTLIFNDMKVEEYIKNLVKDLLAGKLDSELIYKKRLTKPIEEYTKIVPPQVKALLKLNDRKDRRSVQYVITKDGPTPIELDISNIDYDHYIDKQLKPIADSLLPFIQRDFDKIVFNKQPELF